MASANIKWYGGKWIKAVNDGSIKAIRDIAQKIVQKARGDAPKGVSGNIPKTIGYQSEQTSIAKAYIGFKTDGPATTYAIYAERGRKAGKAPPIGALDKWVEVILKAPANKIKGIAYVIGQKIAKFGIKPKWFLRDAFRAYQDEFIRLHRSNIVKEITKI